MRPVSTESHRCMLSPSPGEYKQRRINSLEEHSLPVVPLMWDFNLTPPLFSSSSSLHFPSLSTKQLQDWKEKDSDIAFVRTFSLSSCRCNMFCFSYIIQGFVFNPLTERRASLSWQNDSFCINLNSRNKKQTTTIASPFPHQDVVRLFLAVLAI